MCLQRSDEARKEKKARDKERDRDKDRDDHVERVSKVTALKESDTSNSASPIVKIKRARSRSPTVVKRYLLFVVCLFVIFLLFVCLLFVCLFVCYCCVTVLNVGLVRYVFVVVTSPYPLPAEKVPLLVVPRAPHGHAPRSVRRGRSAGKP